MKDHLRDNILNIITSSTRKKINQLTLSNFRLCDNIGNNFAILMDIFSNKETYEISNYNRLKFEINSKRNSLEFLIDKNLITSNYKITTLGIVVILSHKLGISIFSVFILSRLYYCQITIMTKSYDNGSPYASSSKRVNPIQPTMKFVLSLPAMVLYRIS